MTAMRIQLLGPLLIDGRDGTAVVPAAKQRVLVVALALRAGHVVSFEELADAAWGDDASLAARVTVRNYVLRLRRALGDDGPRIVTRDPGYLLDVAEGDVDALAFDCQCEAGAGLARSKQWGEAAEMLRGALRMWRGTPLADVPSGPLRDHWGRYLEQVRLRALRQRIRADLQVGRHEAVTSELRALTAAHPLDEELWGLLLLALYRSGQQGGALAVYRQARATLVTELGVEPGPDLRRLHEQILAHDPSLDIPAAPVAPPGRKTPAVPWQLVPRQLPKAVPVFTGRSRELEFLDARLEETARDGATAVISAIGGTAGIGKTALAVHFAHRVAARFPEGQLYVNLRGFHPSGEPVTPGQAIRGFLDALGVPADRVPADVDERAALFRSLLAGRRMLVVLDNARDAAQARPLLPGSPGCLVLVTSRDPLASLAVTDGARLLRLDLLTESEASDLLAARLGIAAVAAEPDAVAELIGLCARLPLALAVAAGRAAVRPSFPLKSLVSELRGEQDPLGALDAGEESANVRAVFSWSYRNLPDAVARMFRLLGVHPGPDITAEAAASLAAVPVAQSRVALRELTAVGLLTEHVPGRYTFHDLLRSYATGLVGTIDGEAERRAAMRRALDHCLHTINGRVGTESHTLELAAPEPGVTPEDVARYEALVWCETEYHVVLRLIDQAVRDGFSTRAWQLSWAMDAFFQFSERWHDVSGVQRAVLAAARRAGDEAGIAHAEHALGRASLWLGRYAEAEDRLGKALEIYARTGKRLSEANVHMCLATVCGRQQDYAGSLSANKRALGLLGDAGNTHLRANAMNNIGHGHANLGEYSQALAWCEKALALYEELGDLTEMAHVWDSLGYVHRHLGNYTQAMAYYRRALSRDPGSQYRQSMLLTGLGDVYQASGDVPAARKAWKQALAILEGLDHPDAVKARARLDGSEGAQT